MLCQNFDQKIFSNHQFACLLMAACQHLHANTLPWMRCISWAPHARTGMTNNFFSNRNTPRTLGTSCFKLEEWRFSKTLNGRGPHTFQQKEWRLFKLLNGQCFKHILSAGQTSWKTSHISGLSTYSNCRSNFYKFLIYRDFPHILTAWVTFLFTSQSLGLSTYSNRRSDVSANFSFVGALHMFQQ